MGQIRLSGMCSRIARGQPDCSGRTHPECLVTNLDRARGLGMVRLDAGPGQGFLVNLGSASAVCLCDCLLICRAGSGMRV